MKKIPAQEVLFGRLYKDDSGCMCRRVKIMKDPMRSEVWCVVVLSPHHSPNSPLWMADVYQETAPEVEVFESQEEERQWWESNKEKFA